jgi:hypothetical protein
MYALVSVLFSDAGNRIVGTGQAHTIYGAAASAAQEAPKGNAKLRGTGFVRYWLDNARPSRAPQGHAGLAG